MARQAQIDADKNPSKPPVHQVHSVHHVHFPPARRSLPACLT